MEKKLEQILKDLYLLDPSLKENEAVLVQLIQKLIEVKPDIVVDRDFVNNLRAQLVSQIDKMQTAGLKSSWNLLNHLNYAIGSVAIILIAIIGISSLTLPARFTPSIKDVPESGFGPLTVQTEGSPSLSARPQSGGGGGGGVGYGGGGGGLDASKMIAPAGPYEITQVVYKYVGDDFTQPESSVQVLRKVVDNSVVRSISKNISKMGLGLADFTKLNSPAITDMNISEQVEYGYNVSVSLREGWLSFYQNWEKWPQPAPCSDEISCQRVNFVEESQLPDDQAIIRIADEFIKKYDINLANYGPGMINKNWRPSFSLYPRSVETGTQLVPMDIPVIYPLLIDGEEVYEEWGGQIGIMLSVNASNKRVTSAYNIGVQNYERARYSAETDVKKIIELAEKGGTSDTYYYETPTKIVTVKLGTPTLELAQIYKFSNKPGPAEILYVPSLVFPVTDISDKQYFQRENVIIPLESELFNQRFSPSMMPPINIMR